MRSYSVFGLGNPLLDFIAPVDFALLDCLPVRKGTMNLVDQAGMEEVLASIDGYTNIPGGSAANTLRGISWLDRDGVLDPLLFCGAVGPDARGASYTRFLQQAGIAVQAIAKRLPTGCSVILVTPDHERTMCTYLGACREYGVSDLDMSAIDRAALFYATGYMWDTANQKQAVKAAMVRSRKRGLKVCFDLADPFVVRRFHDEFLSWLPSRVDVLFGNRDEFRIMFGEELEDRQLLEQAARISPVVLMKVGCDGCYVGEGEDIRQVEGFCVQSRDTTAAGDCFSAAFIYGMMLGYSCLQSARLANRLAAAIVTVLGCDFTRLDRNQIVREGLS